MIAIDTCVVVRFLTRDDPAQAARAKMQIEAGSVFVPRTVVLEVEWILRNIYRFDRDSIASGLTGLLALPGVGAEDGPAVMRAPAWYGQGLDFADALHLASGHPAQAFATFDAALRRNARGIAEAIPVVAP